MPDDQATDEKAQSPPAEKQKRFWRQLLVIVVSAIAIMLVLKAFVVQPYRIPSQSMQNTLLPGDRVLVNRLIYHVRGIDRGDIIVFSGQGSWGNLDGAPDTPPSNPVVRVVDDVLSDIGLYSNQTFYIKRVIGLPLDETSYLFPGSAPSFKSFSVIVPAGRLWVMGDNREDSADSLDHMLQGFPDRGTIPENAVAGRAFLIIWPLSRLGDLPIPATFKQAALPTGAAALLGAPLLILRPGRRRRGSYRSHDDG